MQVHTATTRTEAVQSPENRPAKPRRSPHKLVLRIGLVIAITIAAAAVFGMFFGAAGTVMAVILVFALAVLFNPEVWSTKPRVEEQAARQNSSGQSTHAE